MVGADQDRVAGLLRASVFGEPQSAGWKPVAGCLLSMTPAWVRRTAGVTGA
jgi:hypothetical protein